MVTQKRQETKKVHKVCVKHMKAVLLSYLSAHRDDLDFENTGHSKHISQHKPLHGFLATWWNFLEISCNVGLSLTMLVCVLEGTEVYGQRMHLSCSPSNPTVGTPALKLGESPRSIGLNDCIVFYDNITTSVSLGIAPIWRWFHWIMTIQELSWFLCG